MPLIELNDDNDATRHQQLAQQQLAQQQLAQQQLAKQKHAQQQFAQQQHAQQQQLTQQQLSQQQLAQQQQHAQQLAQQQRMQQLQAQTQRDQQQNVPQLSELNVDKIDRVDLPKFWNQKPQLWFASVEAQFVTKRVTADSTKYFMVIAKFDRETLTVVEHIVANPPSSGKNDKIKEVLMKHYCVSDERKIRTLISGLELGSKRPSELLSEIHRLGGPQLVPKFAKTLWLDRLPQF